MSLLKFFGLADQEPAPRTRRRPDRQETETVRKITEALDRLDPAEARYIAAFAYVLSRAARADLHISEMETRTMERIVIEHSGLPEEEAILVVQIAKTQNLLFGGTEDYIVTRVFNKIASREQKLALMDCLFAVAAAEGLISMAEDTEIRQIAREFKLEHRDFIAVRSNYRDHLSVLKKRSQ
jgi:uncharacterized tellurite resistance protein B-like protein